ncbi:hypothetical protein EXIGLDRAFT_733692 [Exidia glandulosa HHB12029]|uniref:Uncharacterized protein n=1 Tax=Exidia glandulosa HHB12029 TaxID=1314781 RepID=A0A165B8C1_EXIGL|nr:hypothetical protein EXIGLDRAFT_733692 [Exidia glandulosa HHB12029]
MSSRFAYPTRVATVDYCSRSQSGETTFAVYSAQGALVMALPSRLLRTVAMMRKSFLK